LSGEAALLLQQRKQELPPSRGQIHYNFHKILLQFSQFFIDFNYDFHNLKVL